MCNLSPSERSRVFTKNTVRKTAKSSPNIWTAAAQMISCGQTARCGRRCVINLHFVVLFTYNHEKVKVGYSAVSSHVKMEELDSLESLTEENGVRKQTSVVRKKREVRDGKETLCASQLHVFVLLYSCNRRRNGTICASIYMCCFFFVALCCPLIFSSSLMDHHREITCCYFLFKVDDEQYVGRACHDCILYRLLTHITSQRRVVATITMEMGLTTM